MRSEEKESQLIQDISGHEMNSGFNSEKEGVIGVPLAEEWHNQSYNVMESFWL